MREDNIKNKIWWAKKKAKEKLEKDKWDVINSDNEKVCFLATFGNSVTRLIRVVIDDITEIDREIISKLRVKEHDYKEIWCKSDTQRDFIIEIYDHKNKLIS